MSRSLSESLTGASRLEKLFRSGHDFRSEASDDYAIRKIPPGSKQPAGQFLLISMGAVCSVFAIALGGTMALSYGFDAALVATGVIFVVGSLIGGLVAWQSSNSSMGLDLITRGVGFGFMGSTVTVLIYGLNYVLYSGFEASFLSSALHGEWAGVPLVVWYLVSAAVFVPLTWYGVTAMGPLQGLLFPLFVGGAIWIGLDTASKPLPAVGVHAMNVGISASTLLPALGLALANLAIIVSLTGDYARFVPKSERRKTAGLSILGVMGVQFLLEVPFGAFLAVHTGIDNPGAYAVALIGGSGLTWILVTQTKVQMGNYYSGSLALTNFFTRTLQRDIKRWVFGIVMAIATFVLLEINILGHLTQALTFLGVFVWAWLGIIMWGIIRQRLFKAYTWIEHRRGYLKDWQWPALTGLAIGTGIGTWLDLSDTPRPYGPLLGLLCAMIVSPLVYEMCTRVVPSTAMLARTPPEGWRDTDEGGDVEWERAGDVMCPVCAKSVSKFDALEGCPVTAGGVICSGCCTVNATCHAICKRRPNKGRSTAGSTTVLRSSSATAPGGSSASIEVDGR